MKPLIPAAAWCCAMVVLAANPAQAAEEFPYRAVVTGAVAKVYAGPGQHYYDTAELPEGSVVEVYEETGNGYCAVRPPEGSFSWTPASAVRMLDAQTGEVTRVNAPSRVGSLLHDRRDAVHVRLDQGERVRVLAERELDGVRWLQIAPPSGEFRWIKREQLTHAGVDAMLEEKPGWVRAAAHSEPAEPGAQAEIVDAVAIPTDPAAESPTTAPPAPLTGTFAEQISALDLELSQQVTEMPTLWRLEPIEQRAAQLMTTASNEAERIAVRNLAARVDRFASIANRYRALRTAPQLGLTKSTTPLATEGVASGFDAVGTLRPVVSKRPGAPQYALVNQEGRIVSFVTAPTELNLSNLLGQRVGVQGSKGYMPEYQQSHLTAGRVTLLDSRLR